MKEVNERIDHKDSVVRALALLTDCQKVVVLATMLGYTQAEIGAILGVSQPTVFNILDQCRAVLRDIL